MSQWRQDLVTGRWVVIAPRRAARPHDLLVPPEPPAPDEPGDCPFCPGHEAEAGPELFRLPGPPDPWRLRVLANKFPVLGPDGSDARQAGPVGEWMQGVGAHEVVVDSPDHLRSFAELPDDHAADVFRTYQRRIEALAQDPRIAYVQVFRNEGSAAGASLRHPHSQLIATPVVPPTVKAEYHGADRWRQRHGGCVHCHLMTRELALGERLVAQDDRFVAWAPFASTFSWELVVMPREHGADFHRVDDASLAGLAGMVKRLVGQLKARLGPLPYNYFIQTAPLRRHDDGIHFHWHLRILPRLTQAAGFEWGSGFSINPVAPEEAAAALRGA
jgi:UDPglucose--hexose-1-phosphate uridylyltransferase